tara:strand:+ start:3122 stop:3493 length:372 start_codon:yes stop_codon:yes gene_type:complete
MSIYSLPNDINNCPCSENNSHELYINYNNVNSIREQIKKKQDSFPYYSTYNNALSVITDYDTWPYPRRFRGIPASAAPIVMEREAGWRAVYNNAYKPNNCSNITEKCIIGPFGLNVEKQISLL